MKKLYFVRTNGYDMVISVGEEKQCRYLTETEEFPANPDQDAAKEFLEAVEDDSSWEEDLTYDELFANLGNGGDYPEVLAEIEKEL